MHTGEGKGGGGYETAPPPRQIFEKLVNKNAIKCKIGGPPWQFFLKPLTPLGILTKTSRTPSPGFSTRVHLCACTLQEQFKTIFRISSFYLKKIFVTKMSFNKAAIKV